MNVVVRTESSFRQLLIITSIYHTDILTISLAQTHTYMCMMCVRVYVSNSDKIRDHMLFSVLLVTSILFLSLFLFIFSLNLFKFLHDEVVVVVVDVVARSFVHWTISILEENERMNYYGPFNKKWRNN